MAVSVAISSTKLASLIRTVDPLGKMYISIADSNRLAIGEDILKPSNFIDLAAESIAAVNSGPSDAMVPQAGSKIVQVNYSAPRSTGPCAADFGPERVTATSQKELLIRSLLYLEARTPGTLHRLSQEPSGSKKVVAKERSQLYRLPRLQRFATQIEGGWWVGTNNNRAETQRFIRIAARLAGVGEIVRFS